MKFKIQYTFAFAFIFGGLQLTSAQKKDENIGTEVVNVVKPYSPTISDAFKVKETPSLDDDENSKKEIINYNIFSFPVASTFTPSKGRAAGVDKSKQDRLFKNYVTGGFGNYGTFFGELYVTEQFGETDYFGGMAKHLSSNGGIDEAEVDNKFLNTSIDLTYGSKDQDFSWNVDAGFQIQKYYWYGLPSDYGRTVVNPEGDTSLSIPERNFVVDRVNGFHTFNNAYIGGRIGFNESMVENITLKYNRFWDDFDSAENRLMFKSSFKFDLGENSVKTEVIIDYLGGEFANYYNINNSASAVRIPIKYGFANFGIHPSYALQRDDWSFNIGASVYYSADVENSDNKLFFYPNATASLNVVGDLMVFYAGADGGLIQNSYRDLTNINPFLSPTLLIRPTDKQFDAFAGLKGKLSNYVSYNVRGSLAAERNKALFRSNSYDEKNLEQDIYQFGNSFGIVYDNVRTLTFFGEIKADFSKDVSFGFNGSFHKYTVKDQAEPWNLPELEFGASLDVNITQKWFAGANLFFVGERKDVSEKLNIPSFTVRTLNSYFDANANVGYKYNERITGFLKFNNIGSQAYQKWLNYPVQSFQVLLGASYKFDF